MALTYKEIRQISNLEEQEKAMAKFYENTIGVNNWLTTQEEQIISFKDKIEYRKNGLLHNTSGPAITPRKNYNGSSDIVDEYYIDGKRLNINQWNEIVKKEKPE